MITSLFLLSIPDYISYPLLSLPIIFAILTWVMNIRCVRSGKAAGIIFNGDTWVKWLFLLFVGVILLQVASWWLPEDWARDMPVILTKNMSLSQKLIIPAMTGTYFLCYFFIAFRPANAEEVKVAKGAKQLAIDFAGSAAGAAAGAAGAAGTVAAGALSVVWSLLYPIVTVGGQTFVYLGVGAASFFASLAMLIPIVVVMAVLGAFVIMAVTFLTFIVMVFVSILKFITNMRFHIG